MIGVAEGRWLLGSHESSPGSARAIVRDLLADQVSPEDVDTAVLVVSELVTNGVRHTDDTAELELTVQATGGVVHVEIRDHDPRPPISTRASAGAESGRGLSIVTALSSHWGWTPIQGNGKRIWCEIVCRGP